MRSPASFSRPFSEFVPNSLRLNQNDQIPLLKNCWPSTLFRRASSLWSFFPLVIKLSASHSIFINRLNVHHHLSKLCTRHLLEINPRLTSIHYVRRGFTQKGIYTNPRLTLEFVDPQALDQSHSSEVISSKRNKSWSGVHIMITSFDF